ncbi:LysM domain-containing protein [Lactobacillus sp. ESL0791]|uniref:LysM peptidoglycan-binding domain-containing protein n=1 Tax=Lactobacillus sp. ESL0791 TaxID=2983234 RepID=UPI0023FA1256|nr:LysM domain-containing protein [Lactobacillus sp. ESL0791]MDF7639981.1 LysM domain-containing protein [Lactobacillus sp. ESL0791]
MSTYPRIAWATSMTPSNPEHYQELLKHHVKSMIICLHLSGVKTYEVAEKHTKAAKKAGMSAHAGLITDLTNPLDDARCFYRTYKKLGYSSAAKVVIFCMHSNTVNKREEKLQELLRYIACFVDKAKIDITFNKNYLQKFEDVAKGYNLTIFNPGSLNAGVKNAGTWIYTNTFANHTQYLGYDFYGFYTGNSGFQLSWLDDEYIAKPGDTWVTVATLYDIWLPDLLKLNSAKYDDLVVPGQHIKVR